MEVKDQLREKLLSIQQKHASFKQQQFTFIAALESSRVQACEITESISTLAQVERYMTHHCNNTIHRRIFLHFLDIIADIKAAFELLESSASVRGFSNDALETCKKLLSPDFNISPLHAQYPHDVINRLSCDEVRIYAGVVSVIPLALDLLKSASTSYSQYLATTYSAMQDLPVQLKGNTSATQTEETSMMLKESSNIASKDMGGWKEEKPAWKPPGYTG